LKQLLRFVVSILVYVYVLVLLFNVRHCRRSTTIDDYVLFLLLFSTHVSLLVFFFFHRHTNYLITRYLFFFRSYDCFSCFVVEVVQLLTDERTAANTSLAFLPLLSLASVKRTKNELPCSWPSLTLNCRIAFLFVLFLLFAGARVFMCAYLCTSLSLSSSNRGVKWYACVNVSEFECRILFFPLVKRELQCAFVELFSSLCM
jgi:phosphoglycerol transferase MdoB-like AlkP superfamily enzyme